MTVELIDSHAHLNDPAYDEDRQEVLARARAAGVRQIVVVGSGGDLATAQRAVDLAERDPDVFAAVGIHPHDAHALTPALWDALAALARHPRVVAVGETGLDYFYDHSPREVQRQAFRDQIRLALEADKPVVCHIRDAHDHAREILDQSGVAGAPGRVLIHCFTGTPDDAAAYVRMGCYVSFSGIVTFKGKKNEPLRAALRSVPLDRLLVETDCPYLAPTPHRGKRNEPGFVVHTAETVATELGLDFVELAARTVANTRSFFSLTRP
jgi:TatD DNase family protein